MGDRFDHKRQSYQQQLKAQIDALDLIVVTGTIDLLNMQTLTLIGQSGEVAIKDRIRDFGRQQVRLQLSDELKLGRSYQLHVNEAEMIPVTTGNVVRSERFNERFYYSGELGPIYDKQSTLFKLWAPTATAVRLVTYDHWHEQIGTDHTMIRSEKGVWHLRLEGNQDGRLYLYRVCVDGHWREAVDPYAKAVSVNGEKGIVLDAAQTDPKTWANRPAFQAFSDAIIYEAHVRDLTIDPRSGICDKGKYLGVVEKKRRGPKDTITGLDYMVDLGITHLELLPLNDFGSVDESNAENQYNWGYDPVHYFAPEGSYATDPYDGKTRVRELKTMVNKLHHAGVRVILDVVFNHVYIMEQSHFEAIVPGYYFRCDEQGERSNGTGVGNDLASEQPMMRKFIVDCVTYWANEYHIDGFRFDLMGILDVDTMSAVRRALDQIDPSLIILGEGWDLPTPLKDEQKAKSDHAANLPGVCFFNDRFRDGVKGSTFDLQARGFINGHEGATELLKTYVKARLDVSSHSAIEPYQSINYIEAHDNHTLWDKLETSNAAESEEMRAAMHRLGTAIVLTAQGIPFLHAGQEFYRTKFGDANSYQSSDVINQLDWERKAHHSSDVDYIRGLIAIRKHHPAFRLRTKVEVDKHLHMIDTPQHTIGYHLTHLENIDSWREIVVIHNGSWTPVTVHLPATREWGIVVDEKRASLIPLLTIKGCVVTVKPIQTMILCQT